MTISSNVAKARAAVDVEEIIDLLCTSRVAWITKAENDELTKRGLQLPARRSGGCID